MTKYKVTISKSYFFDNEKLSHQIESDFYDEAESENPDYFEITWERINTEDYPDLDFEKTNEKETICNPTDSL